MKSRPPCSPPWLRPLLLAACAFSAPPGQGQNLPRGQELFEDQCQACHDDFQQPENRHLSSLAELRKRIEAWGAHTGTGWKKDEVDDVLWYLNRMFYKFPEQRL